MRRVLIWLAVALFPVFAAALYFGFLNEPYLRIETKQMELKMVREKRVVYLRAREVGEEIAQQKERVRGLLELFALKAEGIDRAGVPVFIGEVAKDANVDMAEIVVRGEAGVEGCTFLTSDIRMSGRFVELFWFLRSLEEAEGRFVFLDQLDIAPGRAGEAHELTARVNVLLGSPRATLRTEEQEGLSQDTGQTPVTAISPMGSGD